MNTQNANGFSLASFLAAMARDILRALPVPGSVSREDELAIRLSVWQTYARFGCCDCPYPTHNQQGEKIDHPHRRIWIDEVFKVAEKYGIGALHERCDVPAPVAEEIDESEWIPAPPRAVEIYSFPRMKTADDGRTVFESPRAGSKTVTH